MTFASILLLGNLAYPQVGGEAILPDAAAIQVRMLFLRSGMDRDEVEATMRLGKRFPLFAGGTLFFHSRAHRVGSGHTFTINYRYDSGRKTMIFERALLTLDGKEVLRVSSPSQAGATRKNIDSKLLEETIRAFQKQDR